jgi:GoLoco motif
VVVQSTSSTSTRGYQFSSSRHSEERATSLDEDSNFLADEKLYDLIVQSQAYRIDDQRSELGGRQTGKKTDTGEDDGSEASRLVSPRAKGKKISRATSSHQ